MPKETIMPAADLFPEPASLLVEFADLFVTSPLNGPILDLACGDGRNGVLLAVEGLSVVCCDRSQESLEAAQELAGKYGAVITPWLVDLESPASDPLPPDTYAGILVFRYLHRPLIPSIRKALRGGGILIYETFTTRQPEYGKPHNPDFLLKPGELKEWFKDWQIIHYFEGIKDNPLRAVAQIVCRKPRDRTLKILANSSKSHF
jgi:SAM-dependent methyltransferase